MLIDFKNIKEITVHGMDNCTGEMTAKIFMDKCDKSFSVKFIKAGQSVSTNTRQVTI